MSKVSFKPIILQLICIILVSVVFIIHSCKKDNKSATIADPTINKAKEWYEATYSTPTVRFAVKINGSTRSSGNSRFDYSKHIKPDWQHGTKYNRYNSDVIELPLDPSSDKISSAFKNMTTGKTVYKPQYSRSSFLLMHDGTGYRAYVMTIIGDSAYMKNDPGKLALTTYRKRDPNFSGMVAYFTPDGKFVASYGYKDGKLIPAPLPSTASSPVANTKSKARFHPTVRELMVTNCIDWYMCYFENDVMVSADYLYTTCDVVDNGGGTTAGGTSPAPVPCPGSAPAPANAATTHTPHAMIRVAAPLPTPIGDDGGLPPPPPTQTTETCPVVATVTTTTVIDTTKDPCAQDKVLASDTGFKSKMQALSSTLSLGAEYAYRINNNNGSPTYDLFNGGPSGVNFNFTTSFFNNTNGFIHSHETNDQNLPIFSPSDLQALYLAVSQGQVHNPSTYIFGLVTPTGTYLLSINSLSKFLQVGAANLNGGPGATSALNYAYNVFVNSSNTVAQNEAGFITFLKNFDNGTGMGLTLMKAKDATLSNWQTVGKDINNLVTYLNCN